MGSEAVLLTLLRTQCISVQGLPYKGPQAGRLNQGTFTVSQSGSCKYRIKVFAGLASPEVGSSWLVDGSLLPVSTHGRPSVCVYLCPSLLFI